MFVFILMIILIKMEIGKYNFNLYVKLFFYFYSGMFYMGFDVVVDMLEL